MNDNLPRTRKDAKDIGAKRYFTGKPCPHGHIAERYTSTGGCAECLRLNNVEQYRKNPELGRLRTRLYVKARRAEINSKRREKRRANPEPEIERTRRWREENPDQNRASSLKSSRRRMASPKVRLENAIRVGVYNSITRGSKYGRRTFALLGYTVDELRAHLERLFQPGMSWENYGEWHVDHKIPLSAHNYETPDDIDFKRAWALENLQPLWAIDNIKKSDKLLKFFQPALALSIPSNDNKQEQDNAA